MYAVQVLTNHPLCITPVCQTTSTVLSTLFLYLLLPLSFGKNTLGHYSETEQCIFAHCVFVPWLHRGSFISLWMVSRQTSCSAFCVCPPVLSFRRKQRKGCSESYTPAFPTTSQVHLKMRSDDTRAPGAPRFLTLLFCSSLAFTLTAACFWRGRKRTTLRLWNSKRLALWCKKGRETLCLLSENVCMCVEWQSNTLCCIPYMHKWNRKKMCMAAVVFPCHVWNMSQP